MQSVAQGVFTRNLEWGLILIGGMIAMAIILLDRILQKRRCTLPRAGTGRSRRHIPSPWINRSDHAGWSGCSFRERDFAPRRSRGFGIHCRRGLDGDSVGHTVCLGSEYRYLANRSHRIYALRATSGISAPCRLDAVVVSGAYSRTSKALTRAINTAPVPRPYAIRPPVFTHFP